MKHGACLLSLLLVVRFEPVTSASQADVSQNPVQRVLLLFGELQKRIVQEGEAEHLTYNKFVDWCSINSKQKQHGIKTGLDEKESLAADIEMCQSLIDDDNANIEEMTGVIATDEGDLKAAAMLRDHEHKDFLTVDQELTDAISTIAKAVAILEKELQKHNQNPAFLQKPTPGMVTFASTIGSLLDAATLVSVDDRQKLQDMLGDTSGSALLQQGQPGQNYVPVSGGILDTLESMQEKASATQLEGRKKEEAAQHNYQLLEMSIKAKLVTERKQLSDTKKDLDLQEEKQAAAKSDLDQTIHDIKATQESLAQMQQDCMNRAAEYKQSQTSRTEELNALANAKKVIQSTVNSATSFLQHRSIQAYTAIHNDNDTRSQAVGFLQTNAVQRSQGVLMAQLTGPQRAGVTAWKKLAQLAKDTQSVALAQLANKLSADIRGTAKAGAGAGDPFVKVKQLIQNMIKQLDAEGRAEESHKEFCDREMKYSEQQKNEKTKRLSELDTDIDKLSAESAQLKEQITDLSQEIGDLEKSLADALAMRKEETSNFNTAITELKEGIKGIQTSMTILRDYYGNAALLQTQAVGSQIDIAQSMGAAAASEGSHQPQTSAVSGILGLLEMVESDMSKNVAEAESDEQQAQDAYDKFASEAQVVKAVKEHAVKHKNKETLELDKRVGELTNDRSQHKDELDAINEYWDKLQAECIAKPESSSERKARRERELQGLQEALTILQSEGN